eukprot:Hpha_TRINITY_DN16560_c2_g1::TRINITY_DN16560_c2_g1_i1::g.133682::m.133682
MSAVPNDRWKTSNALIKQVRRMTPKLKEHIESVRTAHKQAGKGEKDDLNSTIKCGEWLLTVAEFAGKLLLVHVALLTADDAEVDPEPYESVLALIMSSIQGYIKAPDRLTAFFEKFKAGVWNHRKAIGCGSLIGASIGFVIGGVLHLAAGPILILVGLIVGGVVGGGIGYCCSEEILTPEEIRRREFVEIMKGYEENGITEKDIKTLHTVLADILKPAFTPSKETGEMECPVCLEEWEQCHHAPGDAVCQNDLFAVLPFECNHPICFRCYRSNPVCACPMCRQTNIRSTPCS